jgi:hypothetical protein
MTKGSAKLRLVWLVTIFLVFLSLVVGYWIGNARDCSKGMNDAGCGLRTFEGLINGAIGGLVIIGCVALYTVISLHQRRKIESSSDRTLID